MRSVCLALGVVLLCTLAKAESWQETLGRQLPLLGHRNWILVVDSAYPLQVSPGVETIDTQADHFEVLQEVFNRLSSMKHVRPNIFEDRELAFVPESDAPGVDQYRAHLKQFLNGQPVETVPHEQIIGTINEAGKTFRVLILKTNLTVPYTSIFLQLDCRYWSADAEKRLRLTMKGAGR